MWCTHCQQDVPGIFSIETGRYRCPRCVGEFADSSRAPSVETAVADPPKIAPLEPPATADVAGLPAFDGWELEEELRHVERLLVNRSKTAPERRVRIDSAHVADEPRPSATSHSPKRQRRDSPGSDSQRGGPAIVWPLLSLGMMTFVCGGVLVGWSVLSGRADLWNFGLPIALLGQIALLAGLALQLERIWSDYRETASKLEHVDDQLHDLKTTTTMLGTSQSTAGNSFYAHLAGGAGPQLLLTDLKSQLDLLAVRISQDEGN